MRILQISTQAPGNHGGGEMGIAQTLLSLTGNHYEVDYAGPEIADAGYRSLYSHVYALPPSANVPLRIFDTLCGYTNSRYRAWKRFAAETDLSRYDCAVMDFTKLDYCLPAIRGIPLAVRVHNVEADYARKDYETNHGFRKAVICRNAMAAERKIAEAADVLVCLTENDRKRLQELYPAADAAKYRIVPVCISRSPESPEAAAAASVRHTDTVPPAGAGHPETTDGNAASAQVRLLITGSLWFEENVRGILWFLDEVLPVLTVPCTLTIAGARPADVLRERVRALPQVSLVSSPESMAPYFRAADAVIAPVFDGAGMKVKVAEALSYGKPVIGTSHAFIGYGITQSVNSWQADTKEEFAAAVHAFAALDQKGKLQTSRAAFQLYQDQYSMAKSTALWNDILTEITEASFIKD